MTFAFSSQPLKTIYYLVDIPLILFVRLPYWIAISSIPALRPKPSWTFKRTLLRHVIAHWMHIFFTAGPPQDQSNPAQESLEPGKTGFTWVEPVPQGLITGEIADIARRNNVEPAQVFGYWFGSRGEDEKHGQPAGKGERVVMFLHGGGYVLGSSHPDSLYGNVPTGILAHSDGLLNRVFSLSFRLAASAPFTPKNPFPTAVIDALSGYHYLVTTLGFAPDNIVLCGDSCGGHLAVALSRYLMHANLPGLSMPRALVLLSPTLDLGNTHDGTPQSTIVVNDPSDYIRVSIQSGYTGRSVLGPALDAKELDTNVWLSPASLRLPHPEGVFRGLPQTCIVASGAEVTVDQMRTARDRMETDMGKENVLYLEYPEAMHDFLVLTFHEPERTEALIAITNWIRGIYGV